jgi:hypothetical protein
MEKGFTETAFMSTTGSLEVALDYSGVKAGKVGSVSPPYVLVSGHIIAV